MPLDAARWQLEIAAADKTAAAFKSVEQRMKRAETQARAAGASMTAGMRGAGAGSIAGDFEGLLGLVARFVPALTAAGAAWKTWNAGMAVADYGEQAEQLGITTDQLQAYRFVAEQAGVTVEQFDSSLQRLTKAMGEANGGNDDMIAKFDRLGVKLLDSKGKLRGAADVLPELANGLLQVESTTERNALMMDFFGKSGSRMATVLGDLTKGNDELVRSGKAAGAIASADTIAKWDALSDAWKRSDTRVNALLATLTAPAAHEAANLLQRLAKNAENATIALNALPKDAGFLQKLDAVFGGRYGNATMGGLRLSTPAEQALDALEAEQKKLDKLRQTHQNNPERGQALAVQEERVKKMEAAYKLAAQEAKNAADMQRLLGNEGAPGRDAPKSTGTGQPTGNAAAKAGANEAAALAKAQREESEKVYKDILANIDKVMKAGEAMTDRFGRGMETATRKTAELDEMLAMGAIDADTYAIALRNINSEAEAQERAFLAAKGGFDAFMAGFDQGLADLAVVNREFEYGKMAVDLLSESIDILAGVSNKSFGQMALDFALMVAKMEAAAAASQAWKAIGGFSGIGNIISSAFSAIVGGVAAGTGAGGVMDGSYGGSLTYGGPRAAGGPVSPDNWYMVGENGPERFVPNTAGWIIPNGAMRGGGATIIINQYMTVGEVATPQQVQKAMRVTYKAALEGSRQGIISDGQRGDPALSGALR